MPPLTVSQAVSALENVGVLEIGTRRWLTQARAWAALASASAAAAAAAGGGGGGGDAAQAALLRAGARGLPLAVSSLLAGEAWRTRVLPRLARRAAASRAAALLVWHALQAEAHAAAVLELALFDEAAARTLADAGTGEVLLDTLDYCVRALTRATLAARARARGGGGGGGGGGESESESEGDGAAAAAFATLATKEAAATPPTATADTDELPSTAAQLAAWCREADFNLACAAASMLRFLAEHAPALPLALLARMLDRHDVPLLMVPLIENPPWVRRLPASAAAPTSAAGGAAARWQKYAGRQWRDVAPGELLRLTPLEGQPWLTLHALLLEPDARRRYALHSQRCAALLRVRRYLTDTLLDQLPPLTQLRRFLDEAALLAHSAPAAATCAPAALLEPVVAGLDDIERAACAQAAAIDDAAEHRRTRGAGGKEDAWDVVARVIEHNLFDGAEAAAPEPTALAPAGSRRELLRGGDEREYFREQRAAAERLRLSPRATIAELAATYDDDDGDDNSGVDGDGDGAAHGEQPLRAAAAAAAAATAATAAIITPAACCAACNKTAAAAAALKRCSRCEAVSYCSQKCQLEDWTRRHKATCRPAPVPASPPAPARSPLIIELS